MESIYVSQKDMLEICQDGDKYFLRYPTFNITCPEVIREIPKEAADSYMSGEHTGKELMNQLLLVDSVDWEEEIEAVHLEILQEKINNYIHFLESKQYVERYGDSFDKKVIHITFQYSPSDNGLAFLAAVQKVLQPTDMSLKLELPE